MAALFFDRCNGNTLCNKGLRADRLTREQQKFFEAKIRPVLVEHCYECHSAKSDEVGGKLLLDSRDGIRRGGESAQPLFPVNPAAVFC